MANIAITTRTNPSFEDIGNSSFLDTTIKVNDLSAGEREVVTKIEWKIFEQSQVAPIIRLSTTSAGASISSPIITRSSLFKLHLKLGLRKYYEVQVKIHTTEEITPWSNKVKFKTRNATYKLPDAQQKVTRNGVRYTTISPEVAYKKQFDREDRNAVSTSSLSIGDITPRCSARIGINQYSTDTSEWVYGVGLNSRTGIYSGVSNAGGNTNYQVYFDQLFLEPGEYTLNGYTIGVGITKTGEVENTDEITVSIWRRTGNTATKLIHETLETIPPTTSVVYTDPQVVASPQSFTVEEGYTYYWAYGMNRLSTSVATPGTRYTYPGVGREVNFTVFIGNTATIPDTVDVSSPTVSDRSNLIGEITLGTANRKIFSQSVTSGQSWVVPKPVTSGVKSFTKISDVSVSATNSLTFALGEKNDASNDVDAFGNIIVDMGTPDTMQFGPNGTETSVNLNDGEEVGDTIDLGIDTRVGGTTYHDLFYMNTADGQGDQRATSDGRDITTISHWAKDNASAPTLDSHGYAFEAPHIVKISGTGSVGNLEIGREPVVVFGDSQGRDATNRLGSAWPTAFAENRIHWEASISGNFWATSSTASTKAVDRYKHGTPGRGDLAYMRSALFIMSGLGVNGATSATYIDDILSDLNAFFANVAAASHQSVLFLGLPTVPGESGTIRINNIIELNEIFHTEAVEQGYGFYNPYAITLANIEQYTAGTSLSYFESSGNVHYKSPGPEDVTQAAAELYESNLIKKYADC